MSDYKGTGTMMTVGVMGGCPRCRGLRRIVWDSTVSTTEACPDCVTGDGERAKLIDRSTKAHNAREADHAIEYMRMLGACRVAHEKLDAEIARLQEESRVRAALAATPGTATTAPACGVCNDQGRGFDVKRKQTIDCPACAGGDAK